MGVMLAMGWSTFSGGLKLKRDSESINERYHEIRVALARMNNDLSSAYISANEDQNLEQRRTMFIGKDEELRFSSLAHRVYWANANESEQTLISYALMDDPDDSSKTNLVRRETRRLSNERWDSTSAEVDVLLRDVQEVEFTYFDWRDEDWKKEWDSTAADKDKGRIPTRVKIEIELKSAADKPFKLTTQARLMMQEEFRFFAN
jgi:general secretion pathway protein J